MTAVPGFDFDASAKLLARYDLGEDIPVLHLAYHLGDALEQIKTLEAERDAFRVGDEIARRHADGWHPEFGLDPKNHRWVSWQGDERGPEPLTAEQYAWYQARWFEQHVRKADR